MDSGSASGVILQAPSLARMAAVVLLLALVPLGWWAWRGRAASPRARLAALLALTAFLTFDLIVFGAFTRLADAGLGCPDWPGCYGAASPVGARADIQAAQSVQPDGPVTWAKAWVEMIHRYLAMTVGVLIIAIVALSWKLGSARPYRFSWALLTLAWVVMQGLFGKYTVTLKLQPVIVTLHLLGGMGLLALLVAQTAWARGGAPWVSGLPRTGLAALAALLLLQLALGGWVSSNYAVLACQGFPRCNGQWWPTMDLPAGFHLWRPLGVGREGDWLPFDALVGIHMSHRGLALVLTLAAMAMAWALHRRGGAAARGPVRWLLLLLALQWLSGLSNVVLGWPLAAALLHSAGAAGWVAWCAVMAVRWRPAVDEPARRGVNRASAWVGEGLR